MLRKDISEKYKWKIEDIYETDEKWEDEINELSHLLENCDIKENFPDTASSLADAFEEIDKMSLLCERLYVYSRMKRDEDNANSKYQAMFERAHMINIKVSSALSFFNPALLEKGEEKLLAWIKEEKRLAPYAFGITELLRAQKHVLDEKSEQILSKTAEFSTGAKDIFTMLNNADLEFDKVDGKPLTHGSYILFLQDKDESIRKQAYEKLYGEFKAHINTIAATYATSVKKDCFYANVRGYENALSKAPLSAKKR